MTAFTRSVIVRLLGAAAIALAAGCGGSDRRDNDESGRSFDVQISRATFPERQTLAGDSELRITVENKDGRTVPNVAVTVDSFTRAGEQAGEADPRRPVWIVDAGPVGGETANAGTWALGPLAPGQRRTFTWKVTAVAAGAHEVAYRVSPSLGAETSIADPAAAAGRFRVRISGKPTPSRVDPQTGAVVRGGPDGPAR